MTTFPALTLSKMSQRDYGTKFVKSLWARSDLVQKADYFLGNFDPQPAIYYGLALAQNDLFREGAKTIAKRKRYLEGISESQLFVNLYNYCLESGKGELPQKTACNLLKTFRNWQLLDEQIVISEQPALWLASIVFDVLGAEDLPVNDLVFNPLLMSFFSYRLTTNALREVFEVNNFGGIPYLSKRTS